MRIHEANAPLKQGMSFDHATYFARLSDLDHRELIKSEGCYSTTENLGI